MYFSRSVLGLSNQCAGDVGVETSRENNLMARQRRLALQKLLADAGVTVAPASELSGFNRRAAQLDLATLAARVFAKRFPQFAAVAIALWFALRAYGRRLSGGALSRYHSRP